MLAAVHGGATHRTAVATVGLPGTSMELAEEVGALRRSAERRLSVLDVVLYPAARYRRWRQVGLAVTMFLLVVAGLRLGQSHSPEAAVARAPAPVEVQVTTCPVPARDYAGLRYQPQAAPATLSVPASLAPPANARIFGTWFMPGPPGRGSLPA